MSELRDMLRSKADPIRFDAVVPPSLRRRIGRRRIGTVIVASLIVSAVGLATLSIPKLLPDRSSISPARPPEQAEAPPADVRPLQVLEPGTHHVLDFAVPFRFVTEQEGWGISPWYTSSFVAIEHYDGGRLTGDIGFHVIDEVFDPRQIERVIPAPADLVRWIERHPMLEVTSRRAVQVAGLQGTRLEVRAVDSFSPDVIPACAAPCVPLAFPSGSPTSMQVHDAPRPLWVLEVAGTTIVINTDPQDPTFSDRAEAFLRTVRFAP